MPPNTPTIFLENNSNVRQPPMAHSLRIFRINTTPSHPIIATLNITTQLTHLWTPLPILAIRFDTSTSLTIFTKSSFFNHSFCSPLAFYFLPVPSSPILCVENTLHTSVPCDHLPTRQIPKLQSDCTHRKSNSNLTFPVAMSLTFPFELWQDIQVKSHIKF